MLSVMSRAGRVRRRSDRGSDRGSVALAVTVIVILAGLTAVMLTRDSDELRHARTTQDRAIVLGALDQAIAAGSTRAAVDAGDFEMSGSAGGAAWHLEARRVDPDRWDLTATADLRTVHRRVTVQLIRAGGSDWRARGWHETGPG